DFEQAPATIPTLRSNTSTRAILETRNADPLFQMATRFSQVLRSRPPSGSGPGNDADQPVRLGHGQVDVLEPLQALPPDRGQQVLLRQELLAQRPREELPVPDENPRVTLDKSLDVSAAEHHMRQEEVRGEQDAGTEQTADQRVVVPDHGVLEHVRQREEHDDVERGELAQLAPPEDPDRHQ